ncbi:MAG TPA: septum formation initiator family protein [Streptosporangiaceae bacterium]
MAPPREGPGKGGSTPRRAPARPAAGTRRPTASRGRTDHPARTPGPPRSHLTSRAAILAIVVCAITLSLAYPVREYIAQRRQISALEAQQQAVAKRVSALEKRKAQLGDDDYVRREAARRLHFCYPGRKCYIVLHDEKSGRGGRPSERQESRPWFTTLWKSVEAADHAQR